MEEDEEEEEKIEGEEEYVNESNREGEEMDQDSSHLARIEAEP
jgi:hypothetical protein